MERLTDAQLANEIQCQAAEGGFPATVAALLELQERREAEKCQTCKGVGAPWNNSSSVACDVCNGTGKRSATKQIYEIATRELSEPGNDTRILVEICTLIEGGKNSPADELLRALRRLMAWSVGENALTKHSDVMDQARAAISRYEER